LRGPLGTISAQQQACLTIFSFSLPIDSYFDSVIHVVDKVLQPK